MDPRLQRRVQRYGWDKAAAYYDQYWSRQLEPAQDRLLAMARLREGERVLDVACGTGLVTFRAADAVGPTGTVVGTDISDVMVARVIETAAQRGMPQVTADRSDAEEIGQGDETFDVVLCALGSCTSSILCGRSNRCAACCVPADDCASRCGASGLRAGGRRSSRSSSAVSRRKSARSSFNSAAATRCSTHSHTPRTPASKWSGSQRPCRTTPARRPAGPHLPAAPSRFRTHGSIRRPGRKSTRNTWRRSSRIAVAGRPMTSRRASSSSCARDPVTR